MPWMIRLMFLLELGAEWLLYNKQILALLDEYKILRKSPNKINSDELIKKNKIKRNNKLITYKQLSKILQKYNILSQKKMES